MAEAERARGRRWVFPLVAVVYLLWLIALAVLGVAHAMR